MLLSAVSVNPVGSALELAWLGDWSSLRGPLGSASATSSKSNQVSDQAAVHRYKINIKAKVSHVPKVWNMLTSKTAGGLITQKI